MDADAPARRASLNLVAHLPAVVAYAVLTILVTWPLALSPGRTVPHDPGDPLMSATILWWNAQVLPFSDAWWNGPFFYPAQHALALSDHRVGLGIFSTPMTWAGASPITVYNVTFLLTWWLSAIAAYALAWTLTSSRPAAFLAGCVFGFNPFRAAHLPHLELLAAYCLPVVLLSLHAWLMTRKSRWLCILAAALLLQALTSGYFFFFMTVLIGLWLLWFARALSPREYASLALALVAPFVIVLPVLLRYQRVHREMGLSRSVAEIRQFSADLVALATAHDSLWFWHTPARWWRPEGELMPGLVAVIVAAAGLVMATRATLQATRPPALGRWRHALLAVAIVAAAAAILPLLAGPVAFTIAGVPVSMSSQDKPLSFAVLLGTVWLITSERFREAFRSRSAMVFYCVATMAMWLLALGPEARLMGQKVLYKTPYALLMLLPGFSDAFRAPARFGMLATLTLSAAVAVAVTYLAPRCPPRGRASLWAAIVALVMAESWIYPFPLVPAPMPLNVPDNLSASAAVLELPFGTFEDAIAMFHTTQHHRRSINGASGYEPPHYTILSRAIKENDLSVLNVLRRYGDIAVIAPSQTSVLSEQRGERQPQRSASQEARLAAIEADRSPALIRYLTDGDYSTAWETGAPQDGSEVLIVNLEEQSTITGVRLSSGKFASSFPRGIAIDLTADGADWTNVVAGINGAMPALDAALQDQRRIDIVIEFPPRPARRVRIRQTGQSSDHWAVAEVRVLSGAESTRR